MSEENVEIVKAAYEAYARGGLAPFMEHFTDDVVYRAAEGAPDDRGPIQGKTAVKEWLQEWVDMFGGFTMELLELRDIGGCTVVAVERYGGRARLSGVEADSIVWAVLTVRDGKIAQGQ